MKDFPDFFSNLTNDNVINPALLDSKLINDMAQNIKLGFEENSTSIVIYNSIVTTVI